jgi:hypothetical protein
MRDTATSPIQYYEGVAISTDTQIRADLLCCECEQLLNRNGENWVLANCHQPDGSFPLRTALLNSSPIVELTDVKVYAAAQIPEIKRDQLTYFAASVFWRAGAHSWRTGRSNKLFRLELGPFLEPLRLFLRGETDFPEQMALFVSVSTANLIQFLTLPVSGYKIGFRVREFIFAGITFTMCVGSHISSKEHVICFARSPEGVISIAPASQANRLQRLTDTLSKAKMVGKWKRP